MESCFPPQRLLGSWLHHANESKVFKFTPQRTVSFSFAPCGKRIPGKGNTRAGEAGRGLEDAVRASGVERGAPS